MAAAGHYGNKSPQLVKHYAEDLGYEYISASTKEEFMQCVERFCNPSITEKSIVFEVFTDTESEDSALRAIRDIKTDATLAVTNKLKETVRGLVGQTGVQTLKKILKK